VLGSDCEVPHDAQFETVKAMIGAVKTYRPS
jgi:uroporphyrinogen-III decarboxylase